MNKIQTQNWESETKSNKKSNMTNAQNGTLRKAKRNKADEFYTHLSDVEAEINHYKEKFNGKVVYCNCDDPYESAFFQYFALNFNRLHLKKLIATCYSGSPVADTQASFFDNEPKVNTAEQIWQAERSLSAASAEK